MSMAYPYTTATCSRCKRIRDKHECIYMLGHGFQCNPDLYPEYPNEKQCFVCKQNIEGIASFIEILCGEGTVWVCKAECSKTKMWREHKTHVKRIIIEENEKF